MQRLIAPVMILLSILSASLLTHHFADSLTTQMITLLEESNEMSDQSNWEKARELTAQAKKLWDEHDFPLHVLFRHGDTDGILLSFTAVEQYLHQESDKYAAANAQLICQLQLLSDMESITLSNTL